MTSKPEQIITTDWNARVRTLPYAHLLQTTEWGAFKQRTTGWIPDYLTFHDPAGKLVGAALTLTRRIGPFAVVYIPKGPMIDYADEALCKRVLETLEGYARKRGAIWLKIDPDVVLGTGVPGAPDDHVDPTGTAIVETLKARGWHYSADQVQFRNTITVDLTRSEEDILAAMGQGKRRKVRYGPKHGVTVRAATLDDLPLLYKLYAETGQRDGFLTRPYDYYVDEWGTLFKAGLAHALIAEAESTPLAHVILFHFGRTCWYFYGASVSDNELRKLMPTDLLQWEAMRWAKSQSYAVYDMWGAPNEFSESDSMWGVYQFKRDFGGTVIRHLGAWDYVPNSALYWLYTQAMPQVIGLMRRMRSRK
jgi:lipid II:glycine glycyltransferase (peptidoglycan interpeptide bridge formation enzyme)